MVLERKWVCLDEASQALAGAREATWEVVEVPLKAKLAHHPPAPVAEWEQLEGLMH